MTAYRIPGLLPGPDALADARLDRIRPGGPWSIRDWQGDAFAFRADLYPDGINPERDCGAPRDCDDGLVYHPPLRMPTPGELLRQIETLGPTIDVATQSGVTLLIPLAQAAPRRLLFAAGQATVGEPVGPYVQQASDVLQLTGDLEEAHKAAFAPDATKADRALLDLVGQRHDAACSRLVWLAIQAAYTITEELLSDLGWVSTLDIAPIIHAAWGIDPKAAGRPGGGAST